MREFDIVKYNIGDKVIRKNKSPDVYGKLAKKEVVINTDMLNGGDFIFQVIYFESNPLSANVSYEYEPFDNKERKMYYSVMATSKTISSQRKVKGNRKTKVKPITDKTKEGLKLIQQLINENKNI